MNALNYLTLALGLIVTSSCSEFLAEKPDQKMAVLRTLADLQALLDNTSYTTQNWPCSGDESADFYYLGSQHWANLGADDRNKYVWGSNVPSASGEWNTSYHKLMIYNMILETLGDLPADGKEETRDHIKGAALFYRGWSHFTLALVYGQGFDAETAGSSLGIPLRLSSDLEAKMTRSSLKETYSRIVDDLQIAATLLPDRQPNIRTRPSKAAAYAALSRVYLVMGDYPQALGAAEKSLSITDGLMDYNDYEPDAGGPFPEFNDEVIWFALSYYSYILNVNQATVDTALVDLYENDDLRKQLYFKQRADGSYYFVGDYQGTVHGSIFFAGLAVDELYLTMAECHARVGNPGVAVRFLNELLTKRYRSGGAPEIDATNTGDVLTRVLEERRKEFIYRSGIPWMDLKRLNRDVPTQRPLYRRIDADTYVLQPGGPAYALLIPQQVIDLSGIPQNPR